MLPLDGIRVVDFSQFLAGPMATLRLADLGAEVIKVEKPGSGDLSRSLEFADLEPDHDATPFKSINRNKASFEADLKSESDRGRVLDLILSSDVVVQNFRPGVAERLGIDFASVSSRKPDIVYASFTGYGPSGPWSHLPGQDLLVQAKSGLMWLTGDGDMPPVPTGISIVDLYGGSLLAQGILAALVRKFRSGEGAHVETSLIEAAVDLQVQEIGAFLNAPGLEVTRSDRHNAHPMLPAPYGVYPLVGGWLALAMMPLSGLANSLDFPELLKVEERSGGAYHGRDEIKAAIADRFKGEAIDDIVRRLEADGIWCAKVLDWPEMLAQMDDVLHLIQTIKSRAGNYRATRCPIRIDGQPLMSDRPAPEIGDYSRD